MRNGDTERLHADVGGITHGFTDHRGSHPFLNLDRRTGARTALVVHEGGTADDLAVDSEKRSIRRVQRIAHDFAHVEHVHEEVDHFVGVVAAITHVQESAGGRFEGHGVRQYPIDPDDLPE